MTERVSPWDGKIVTETLHRVACRECTFEFVLVGAGVTSQKTAAPLAERHGWRKVRGRGWTCPDCVNKSGKAG